MKNAFFKVVLAVILICVIACIFVACDFTKPADGEENLPPTTGGGTENILPSTPSDNETQTPPSGGETETPPSGGEVENPDESETPDPNPGEGEQEPNPDPEEEEKPTEITNSDIIKIFELNFREGILDKCMFGLEVINIEKESWFLLEENEQVIGTEYTCEAQLYNQACYRIVGKVNFDAVLKEDLKINENIQNINYSSIYRLNYTSAIQEEKRILTDAICDKLFKRADDEVILERYIVDEGSKVDTGLETTVRQFQVVEITNCGVREIGIRIKDPLASLEEYIKKLDDPTNYVTYDFNDNVKFSGNKLELNV